MKMLHVSIGLPPFRVGGLTRYCYDLMREQQKMGHEVELLYPAHYTIAARTHIKTKKEQNFTVHKIINPLPLALVFGINSPERYMKKCNSDCYEKLLKESRTDVIHVHSIMGIHKEFFELARSYNIPIVFTTHDYYPFCIKCSFQDANGELCMEHDASKCMECNLNAGLSKKMEMVMQSNLYRHFKYSKLTTRLRNMKRNRLTSNSVDIEQSKKCKSSNGYKMYNSLLQYYKEIMDTVDIVHGNSELAANIYKKYLTNANYEVIPITHSMLPKKEIKSKKLIPGKFRIGFLGGTRKEKGLDILIEALEKIDEKKVKFELVLWGADYSDVVSDKIKIHNRGYYSQSDLNAVFCTFDVLVVPSKWWETFGYVVLEALICSTPVISSNRVGASMILKDMSIDVVYKSEDANSLADVIHQVAHKRVFEELSNYINKMELNTSMDKHVIDILGLYERLIKVKLNKNIDAK